MAPDINYLSSAIKGVINERQVPSKKERQNIIEEVKKLKQKLTRSSILPNGLDRKTVEQLLSEPAVNVIEILENLNENDYLEEEQIENFKNLQELISKLYIK